VQRTAQGLVVIRVDAERQLLLVKGSVPGSRGRDIVVKPTSKTVRAPGPSGKKVAPAAAQAKSAAAPAKPAAAKAAAPAKPAAPAAKGA